MYKINILKAILRACVLWTLTGFIFVIIIAAACWLKVFPANTNGNDPAVIILPVPIEAVAVRVNPNAWENIIALKLEFYGCGLNCPFTPGKK